MKREHLSADQKKDVRIRFLEDQARWNLLVSNLITSLGDLHHEASVDQAPDRLIDSTVETLKKIIQFEEMGFFLVNEEDSDFVLFRSVPEESHSHIQQAVDYQVENGSFAWALNQNNPVLARSNIPGKTLVLHVLATQRRVRGMFAGILDGEKKELPEKIYFPLSLMMQSTAKGLESIALYGLFQQQNQLLETRIEERTRELRNQANQLREEVAYRLIAEEALQVSREQAEQALLAKEEFLANISHEIRTPLNAILGYGEMIRYELEQLDQPRLVDDFKVIESAGRHLMSVVNDLLDLVNLKSGKMRISRETFDLGSWSEDLRVTVQALAEKFMNTLEWDVPGSLGEVQTDSVRLRQIFLNLLSNACKYTRQGHVSFSLCREKRGSSEWLIGVVRDNGMGIDPEKMGALFEKFERGENARQNKIEGTGLGLPLCLRLSELLGGELNVESELNKGTCVTVEIPAFLPQEYPDRMEIAHNTVERGQSLPQDNLAVTESSAKSSKSSVGSSGYLSSEGRKGGVLVIEEDPVFRNLLCRFIEKEGLRVNIVEDETQIPDQIRSMNPEALLVGSLQSPGAGQRVIQDWLEYARKQDMVLMSIQQEGMEPADLAKEGVVVLKRPFQWEDFQQTLGTLKKDTGLLNALIIQPDSTSRDVMIRLLGREGWSVQVIQDHRLTLSMLQEVKPNLILAESQASPMNLVTLFNQLGEKQEFRNIPVIIVCNRELTDEENKEIGSRAHRVLRKGHFSRQDLLGELHRFQA